MSLNLIKHSIFVSNWSYNSSKISYCFFKDFSSSSICFFFNSNFLYSISFFLFNS